MASSSSSNQPAQQDVYGDNPRKDVAPHVPRTARSVLEVGCGRGGFGVTLRRILGAEARIVGIEAVATQASIARSSHGFDRVITGYFPEALEGEAAFDLLVFNDVLEHLVEPEEILNAAHDYLTPGGRVLAAIPSIQYAPVVARLLRGRWDYADIGTLDRTHLRFFTRATMVEMFERAGYVVESCVGANSVARHADGMAPPVRASVRAAARLIGDARWVHFMLVARSVREG